MSSLVMLVAGDELMSRTLGTQMTDLGYRFTRAGGSREARQLAAHALPAIIIVDLNSVPRGMELLASLDGTEPPFGPLVVLSRHKRPAATFPHIPWLMTPVDGPSLALEVRRAHIAHRATR